MRPPLQRGDDRVIGGVCGAIAAHLQIDPLLVRLVVVGLGLAGGLGIFAYLVAWLFIPPTHQAGRVVGSRPLVTRTVAGILLIVMGLMWLTMITSLVTKLFGITALAMGAILLGSVLFGSRSKRSNGSSGD